MAEQGFAPDGTTWADATDEEQQKMEENLCLPDELPQPFLEEMRGLVCRSSIISISKRHGEGNSIGMCEFQHTWLPL
eukprot:12401989-Karenia_brevis.AAC.1